MNQDNNEVKKTESALTPLKSGQYAVTPIPKTTTDLPFFYLTKQKGQLSKPIFYEGIDTDGRPMRWSATPNATIGSPGIDAHETWTRLVKPTWEAYRAPDNKLPNILPLGGVRQCLRAVGWGEGGWEARRLLRALNQIGATWCNADFSVPTTKLDESGSPTFRLIKGAFSRLAIYAIGEKHLTDEELKDGSFSFEFNLEDTLYIQFHPFEVAIQESQPQRYLDNMYMFSVGPAARRWYELLAAKIFGVVKNNGQYCEVLYSWYIKHHHTLNRQTSRRRIVQQINEVVRAHIETNFIERVEYLRLNEPGKAVDFIIRFYPGLAARQSVTRVAQSLQRKRPLPAGEPRAPRKRRNTNVAASSELEVNPVSDLPAPATPPQQDFGLTNDPALPEAVSKLVEQLANRGVLRSPAIKLLSGLASDRLERVSGYINYWDQQNKVSKVTPGLLFDLIRNGDPLPQGFESDSEREVRLAKEAHENDMTRLKELVEIRHAEHCKQEIDRVVASLPPGDFEQRVEARREEIVRQNGFFENRLEVADQFARHEVRAQIGLMIPLPSLQTYQQSVLYEIAAELNIDLAQIDKAEVTGEPRTSPNAVYGATSSDPTKVEDSLTSEEGSSPEAV